MLAYSDVCYTIHVMFWCEVEEGAWCYHGSLVLVVLTYTFVFLTRPLTQDPNQLIRASALRVLSSIRVPIIAPIMMLAIKEVRTHYWAAI